MGTKKQYLLTFEFRYYGVGERFNSKSKTITIGVFDTIEEAVEKGNESVKELAKTFEVRANDSFKVKGLFGNPDTLVTNTCYKDNVEFFGKITTLSYESLTDVIAETVESTNAYISQRRNEEN